MFGNDHCNKLRNFRIFKPNTSFCLTVTSFFSFALVFCNAYKNVIVIGRIYFVLWNDVHITVQFMLKGYNSSLPWRDPDGKLRCRSVMIMYSSKNILMLCFQKCIDWLLFKLIDWLFPYPVLTASGYCKWCTSYKYNIVNTINYRYWEFCHYFIVCLSNSSIGFLLYNAHAQLDRSTRFKCHYLILNKVYRYTYM